MGELCVVDVSFGDDACDVTHGDDDTLEGILSKEFKELFGLKMYGGID